MEIKVGKTYRVNVTWRTTSGEPAAIDSVGWSIDMPALAKISEGLSNDHVLVSVSKVADYKLTCTATGAISGRVVRAVVGLEAK